MGKRKRTNGCLLSMLKMAIIGSFGLLMSLFGLYMLTTPWEKSIQETSSSIVQVATPKNIDKKQVQVAYEPTHEEPMVKKEETITNQYEEKAETMATLFPEVKEESQVIAQQEVPEEATLPTEPIPVEESIVLEEVVLPGTTVDIPVYNRYELNLSDYVIKEAEDVMKAGQVNVTQLVGQYFSSMSTREKLSLVNMLLGKIKNIDVAYVWGIIADGITDEDVGVLQGLIEENFTEAEIDELYTYYVKSELAQAE